MNSKEEPDAESHRQHAVTENSDTIAQHEKRRRRVSFAEYTSVRFFDRDDEDFNGTPLVETAKNIGDSSGDLDSGGLSEGNKEFEGGDDGGDNNEDDEGMDMRGSFLRPIGSPSPGGSTFGSASSNDEEYFGPVSANFICLGLSDSAASDDNHDVTMDSTAFSMHFRSLARSESGLDLKTPNTGQLFFEEKTPTDSNTGSSMVVTLGKKPIKKSSVPVIEVSGSHNSNDMSLVGENRNMYDYEKLPPELDAFLEESRKNLLHVSVSDNITSVSPKSKADNVLSSVDLGNNLVNFDYSVTEDTGMLNGDESAAHNEFGEANDSNGRYLGPSPNRFSASTSGVAADRDNPKPNNSSHLLSKNEPETSLMVSTSSPVKHQQILLTTASPHKPWEAVSALPEQPGYKNRNIEHEKTETPIQKSISKLELIERSALSSIFSSKIDNSTVKALDFFKSPDNSFKSNNYISRYNFGEDSVIGGKAASVHQSTRKLSYSMDHAKGENHLEGPLSQLVSGKSPNELSSKIILADQSKARTTAASPSKTTWSGNNLIRSVFSSKQDNEDSLMMETESLFAEIASGEGGKSTSPKFVSSPGGMLKRTLPASPGFQSNQSEVLSVQSEIKQIAFDKGPDSTSERNLAHVNFSSEPANVCALSKGSEGELNSPFIEVNCLNLIESEATGNIEIDNLNMKEIIGNSGNFSTPAKENEIQVMHSKNLDVGYLTSGGFSYFEDIPGAVAKTVSHDFVSPSANRNLDQQRLQKSLVQFPAGSPSRKSLENIHPSTVTSPKDIQMSGRLEKLSAKRNLEILLKDTQHKSETNIMGRSPKLQKGDNHEPEIIVYPIEGRAKPTGQKKWTDTYSTFTEEMKILIFGSADELDIKMINVLEDMLVHQQRSKVFEMLHHGVMSQNTFVHRNLQLEKVAEANSLLHRVVFEKAKLQLKNVKRDRLLKRLGLLSSRMQESHILGVNIAALPLETSYVQVDAVGDGSLSVNLKKENEVCQERLTAARQSLEASERKMLNLTRTFHARCKMKAEPGSGDTITLVNEYLIKKASCRFIRLDMQMWVVQSVGSVNGQPYVFLNYLDLIVQSTKLIVGPTSSARTLFELNEKNITKNFPNMDACIAFAFVFYGETIRKYGGAKTLMQETQVTNSLLGTLLDVIEEVQLAQIEFQNLTQTNFCSPSVEGLNLMFCFHNFDSGRKVCLTLDLSCLKRGIYPSEVLPLQKTPLVDSKKSSSSGPISDEIRNAVKGVRSGYMRILRLCRCVSQVFQASTA